MIRLSQLPYTCIIVPRVGYDENGQPIDSDGNIIVRDNPPSVTAGVSCKCNFQRKRRERHDKRGGMIETSGKFTFAPSRSATLGDIIQGATGQDLVLTTGSSITFNNETFMIFTITTSTDDRGNRMCVTCEVSGGRL